MWSPGGSDAAQWPIYAQCWYHCSLPDGRMTIDLDPGLSRCVQKVPEATWCLILQEWGGVNCSVSNLSSGLQLNANARLCTSSSEWYFVKCLCSDVHTLCKHCFCLKNHFALSLCMSHVARFGHAAATLMGAWYWALCHVLPVTCMCTSCHLLTANLI